MSRDARGPAIWLLDVDGVLNAVTRKPDRQVWKDWRLGRAMADGVTWPICYSPTVVRTIRRLTETGAADVRWLTTWGRQANGELRELLGLPELPVAGERRPDPQVRPAAVVASGATSHGAAVGGAPRWWKLAAVRSVVEAEPDRPLVWTDDELDHQPDAARWVADNVRHHLLLSPPPQVGLTPRLLRRIEAFCGQEQPPTPAPD